MIFFVIAALLVVLDQATKFYIRATMAVGATKVLIPNWLGLNYVQNTGAAFSSFDQYTMILAIVSLVVSILLNVIRAVFRFPLLKQLDWLAGGAFGFARGLVFCYALFALVPLVLTVVPFDGISQMIDESQLAAFFNNGNLILSIMNQKLL